MSDEKSPTILIRLSLVFFLVSIFAIVVSGAQDHDVPVTIDGSRCDTCGSECSNMCGSKMFRACCLNYARKRSAPWTKPGGVETMPEGETSLSGGEGQPEEATYLFPVSLREILSGMLGNSNTFENRKYDRVMI